MRVIIAGTRTCNETVLALRIQRHLDALGWVPARVLCGCARGADLAGAMWARANGVRVFDFYPDWARFGRYGGPERNERMAREADALLAYWDGKSKGTRHMIECARELGLLVRVVRVPPEFLVAEQVGA